MKHMQQIGKKTQAQATEVPFNSGKTYGATVEEETKIGANQKLSPEQKEDTRVTTNELEEIKQSDEFQDRLMDMNY